MSCGRRNINNSKLAFLQCPSTLLVKLGKISNKFSPMLVSLRKDKFQSSNETIVIKAENLTVSCGRSSTSVFGATSVLCKRNLSLHCISGGYSLWAWRVTANPKVSWKPVLSVHGRQAGYVCFPHKQGLLCVQGQHFFFWFFFVWGGVVARSANISLVLRKTQLLGSFCAS